MPTFDRSLTTGAIVVVPFPYSDRLAEKRRPALVISGNAIHTAGFCWLLMVTSAGQSVMPHDVSIYDLKSAGLSAASVVRPVKIACVEPGRILRVAGHLSGADLEAVRHSFQHICGLA
jgi:mRNA interferase MazF